MNAPVILDGITPAADTTIDSIFRANAAWMPDADALIDPPDRESITGQPLRRLTYRQADRAIGAIAARLREIGLSAGTVVGLQMPNTVESILTLLAITRAGMVPAPLPLLWRRSDCVAALSRAGARAIVTCGRVGTMDHAQLALDIAAELFPIRVVCGFGCGRVDGIVPFDDCLSTQIDVADSLTTSGGEPSPAAIVTFDTLMEGPVPVLRDHAQLLAGGMLVRHCRAIEKQAVIVSAIPATSFAGMATAFLPWLLCCGTLVLHHPFEPEILASQIADRRGSVLAVPEALVPALAKAETLDTVRTILALWRSPERLAAAVRWPAGGATLVDVVAFGETGMLATARPANGNTAPWPIGNVVITENGRDTTLARVAQTSAGTLGLGGPLAAAQLRAYDLESTDPEEGSPDIVDTGYPSRLLADEQSLVVTASPAGLVNIGGYRFALRELRSLVHGIDKNAVLAAFPHALSGYRLAGHAVNSAAVRTKLEEAGSNPLICNAFHDRLPSPR